MESLVELGFTRLEASVYVFLLKHSPATGYQVAKSINKPNSNTYQALEALLLQGVLVVEEGSPRLFRALPYQEVLRQLEAAFQERRAAAAHDLSRIPPAPSDFQVYTLTTVSQALEKCRAIIQGAKHIIVIDIFPELVSQVKEELAAAVDRGIKVVAKVYEPVDIEGVQFVGDYRQIDVPAKWGIQWLNLVADGQEHMYACCDAEAQNIIHAIWNPGPSMSFLFHSGLLAEMVVDSLLVKYRDTADHAEIVNLVQSLGFYEWQDLPGYQMIQKVCQGKQL